MKIEKGKGMVLLIAMGDVRSELADWLFCLETFCLFHKSGGTNYQTN